MGPARVKLSALLVAVIASALVGVASPKAAIAEPGGRGTLDPTFGRGGIATSELPPAFLYGHFTNLAETPDGDLVVSLSQHTGNFVDESEHHAIERRLPDGSLDPTFGGDGTVTVPEEPQALGVDGDSRVVYVKGRRVSRLNADGSVDPTFAAEIPAAEGMTAQRLAVEADGSVVVAGTLIEGNSKFCCPYTRAIVARVSASGALDPGFGEDGAITTPNPVSSDGYLVDGLATLADGSVLLLAEGVVRRYRPDGSLDPSFGTAGILDPGRELGAAAMTVDPNGGIVLAGRGESESRPSDYSLRRFTATGARDLSFGVDGTAVVDVARYDRPVDLASGPEGGVVLLGESLDRDKLPPNGQRPVVVRLGANGRPVAGFGEDGALAVEPPRRGSELEASPAIAETFAVSEAGRIAVAGTNGDAFLLVRGPGGSPEPTFGAGASAILEEGTYPAVTNAIDLVAEPDGELIVTASTNSYRHNPVTGLLPFRGDGGQRKDVGGPLGYLPSPGPAGLTVVDGPRKLVSLARGPYSRLVRFNRRGRPDRSFGKGGTVHLPKHFDAAQLYVGRDHGVTVVGRALGFGMAVLRLTSSGRRDPRFGHRGLVFIPFGAFWAGARAQLPLPHGRLLLAGIGGENRGALALVRLLPNGRLDRRFGDGGIVQHRVGLASEARLLARQGNGYLVAGVRYGKATREVFIARFGADGSLERSFGRHGYIPVPDIWSPVALLPSRRGFVLVGDRDNAGVLLRAYHRNGRIDRGFGHHGSTVAGRRRGPSRLRFTPAAAEKTPDGRIVVAGSLGDSTLIDARVQLMRFR